MSAFVNNGFYKHKPNSYLCVVCPSKLQDGLHRCFRENYDYVLTKMQSVFYLKRFVVLYISYILVVCAWRRKCCRGILRNNGWCIFTLPTWTPPTPVRSSWNWKFLATAGSLPTPIGQPLSAALRARASGKKRAVQQCKQTKGKQYICLNHSGKSSTHYNVIDKP